MPTQGNSEDFLFSAAGRDSPECRYRTASSATVNNVELVKKAFIFRGINWKTLHEPVLDSFNQVIYSQRYGSLASSVLVDSAKSKTGPELVEFLRRWKVLRILIADDHEVARRGIRAVLESHAGWEVCAEAK